MNRILERTGAYWSVLERSWSVRNKSSRDGLERAVYIHKCGAKMTDRMLESSVAGLKPESANAQQLKR
jgi:hypothetical protein